MYCEIVLHIFNYNYYDYYLNLNLHKKCLIAGTIKTLRFCPILHIIPLTIVHASKIFIATAFKRPAYRKYRYFGISEVARAYILQGYSMNNKKATLNYIGRLHTLLCFIHILVTRSYSYKRINLFFC